MSCTKKIAHNIFINNENFQAQLRCLMDLMGKMNSISGCSGTQLFINKAGGGSRRLNSGGGDFLPIVYTLLVVSKESEHEGLKHGTLQEGVEGGKGVEDHNCCLFMKQKLLQTTK